MAKSEIVMSIRLRPWVTRYGIASLLLFVAGSKLHLPMRWFIELVPARD